MTATSNWWVDRARWNMRGNCGWGLLWGLLAVAATSSARAIERDFSIVTNQSSIAASGNVATAFGTSTIMTQDTGSLTTTYSGTLKTDRESNSISFLSGSAVAANVNGNWRPDENSADNTAPADYGGRVSFAFGIEVANFAARNFVVGSTSGPIAINSGGTIDLSSATLSMVSGKIFYRDTLGQLIGMSDIANKTASISGTGTLSSTTQSGQTTETLTIPIHSTFVLMPDASTTVNLTLTGQLVATTTFAAGLPGDYNQNGVVDAADYVLWRDRLGSGTALPNDDSAGVGNDDYTRWRTQFGQAASSGASVSIAAAVPELHAIALVVVAGALIAGCWRRG